MAVMGKAALIAALPLAARTECVMNVEVLETKSARDAALQMALRVFMEFEVPEYSADKLSPWPNIISLSRAVAAVGLLLTTVFSVSFWVLYLWCGISDMIDGPLARRLGSESKVGATVDSIADIKKLF